MVNILKEIFKQIWVKKICMFLLISLMIEIFICNFRAWLTLGYEKTDLIGENAIVCSDGQYEEDGHIIALFRDDGWCDIDTGQIDVDARNIYLSVEYLDSGLQPVEIERVIDCTIKASDEGNKLLYGLGDRKFCSKIERGNYYSINLYGNARAFELTFQKPENEDVKYVYLSEFAVNKRVPLYFSWLRFFGILIGCVFIELCRLYWNQPFYLDTGMQKRKMVTVIFALLLIVYSLAFTYSNPAHRKIETSKTMYHELTESLLQGKLYLEEEPAPVILSMDNPYDNWYRDQLLKENDQKMRLDAAYYNGKYYVYFGVVPVLLLFLPFYVVTGKHLSITYAMSVLCIVYIIGCFLLLWQLYKKFFSKASFLSYLLWNAMLVVGCGIFYAFRTSSFYACPILTAAVLMVWALNFWILEMGKRKYNYLIIAAGSLLFALVAGSRPQFLIAAFSIFIIFRETIFKKPDKEWVYFAVSVLVPVITVAVTIMYYNYARFENPFDFGANYNLTSNDMTHRGWHLDRIPSGLFYYLFEPTKITLAFPYVHDSASLRIGLSSYMGRTTFERPYGGLMFNSPVLLLSLAVWKVRKYITDKNRKSYQIAVFFTGSAFLILLADIQIGGIMSRYHMDFGIFLCISAMVVMAFIQDKMKEYRLLKWLHILLAGSVVWRFLYEIALWFDDGFMLAQRPLLTFYLRNIIEFWH